MRARPRDGVAPLRQWFNAPRPRSFEASVPIVDILLHLVLGMTVALLDFAFKLLAHAVYRGNVVVSELAPLLLDLADEQLPITFDTIPIQVTLLSAPHFALEILHATTPPGSRGSPPAIVAPLLAERITNQRRRSRESSISSARRTSCTNCTSRRRCRSSSES